MTNLTKLTAEEARNRTPIGEPVNVPIRPINGESDSEYSARVDNEIQLYAPPNANAFCARLGKPDEIVVEVKDVPSLIEFKKRRLPTNPFRREVWYSHPVQFYE